MSDITGKTDDQAGQNQGQTQESEKPAITPQLHETDPSKALKDGEHVSDTSRFAAGNQEGDSVLLDDEAYVGVSTEYRNAAYDKNAPLRSDDEDAAEAEAVAKTVEVTTAMQGESVGFRGYAPDLVHPSERKNLADEALRNRARIDEEARQEVRGGSDES